MAGGNGGVNRECERCGQAICYFCMWMYLIREVLHDPLPTLADRLSTAERDAYNEAVAEQVEVLHEKAGNRSRANGRLD